MAMYEAMMARWPMPYKALNVPTRHGNTFVIVGGKEAAPALLLLHGAGTNSIMWAGDVAEYGCQYQVYAVDLLGEPGKSAPHRPAWDGPAYAEWLEDVLDNLKIERATLIGLSQGGWTALKFAVYEPERVEKLVLLTQAALCLISCRLSSAPSRCRYWGDGVSSVSFVWSWAARQSQKKSVKP